MAVTWKALKYKHRLRAQELQAEIESQQLPEKTIVEFVASLVELWDYIDAETGQPVATGDYGELTIEQFNEVMELFNRKMEGLKEEAVKKKTAGRSSSGSTRSRPEKRAATYPPRPNGLT